MNWRKWKGQRTDNKGSAMVFTIVTVALLSLMVSILLAISLYAYRMRATDLEGKKAFYTAETALDEIRTGLQSEVANAFSEAYIKTMETSVSSTISVRKSEFRKEYAKILRGVLKEATEEDQYEMAFLEKFIKRPFDNTTNLGAKMTTEDGKNLIVLKEEGIILKDVQVKYFGEDDYVSEIKTDILLKYPMIDFAQDGALMDFLNFALIANTELKAENKTGVDVKGSAYLGKEGSTLTQAEIDFSSTDFVKENKLITNKGLKVTQGSALTITDMEVWAQDFVSDSSMVNVDGDVYLSNDLVINNSMYKTGNRTSVVFSGKYCGFGDLDTAKSSAALKGKSADIDANPAKYSSAILVNGGRAQLDLSGLNSMMLAGHAYVAASEKNGSLAEKNTDVPMGESLSIKSNQVAYMVPLNCVAPGAGNGGNNPMTVEKYQALLSELGGRKTDMVRYDIVVPEYGKTLSQLGVNGFRSVSYPMAGTGSNMVYLFMEFDTEEDANAFFGSYAGVAKNASRIDEQLDLYATYGIKVPDNMVNAGSSEFYYSGDIVVNEENRANVYMNKTLDESARKVEQETYQNNFFALGCKLNKSYDLLSDSEKALDVYHNLVEDMTGSSVDAKKKIGLNKSKKFVTSGTNLYAAIVKNGDFTIDSSTVKVNGVDASGDVQTNAALTVVIASGDVTVETDFTGMIIAGGRIIIANSGISISSDPAMVTAALNAANEDGIRALNYLKGFPQLLAGGADGEAEGSKDSISISDLVTYQNWKKQ